MNIYQWLSISLLLLIAGETSYLLLRSKAQPKRRKHGNATLIDTSVLIDGRIVAIARAGFAGSELIVPRSVVAELQHLADMADHDKRTRARHGLDVIQELQQMKHIDLKILQDSTPVDGVDTQLIRLAKRYGAQLSTIDYNLNKVAQVEGVTVLNINELAQALRISYLPGEKAGIELVQPGQGAHQAVGYLADGTMVVVENGLQFLGKEVQVEFTRNLQTQAGRMMFARLVEDRLQYKQASKPKAQNHGAQHRPAQAAQAQEQPQQQNAPKKKMKKNVAPVNQQQRPISSARQGQRRTSRTAEDSLISLANRK
ncbi:MAG TPA: hypothetical protein VFZ48_04545 [Candidatus Saccharimonadales bacterium]